MNPLDIIARFYPAHSRAYELLVRHCQDVAHKAVEVCRLHPELRADENFVFEAAMLHDIGMCRTYAPEIYCYGTEPYLRHGFWGGQMLRAVGLEPHARVAERHTGTGLSDEAIRTRGIQLPPGIYMPQTTEEKIICYADKFYSKSHPERIKTPEHIRESLSKYGADSTARWDEMHHLFG